MVLTNLLQEEGALDYDEKSIVCGSCKYRTASGRHGPPGALFLTTRDRMVYVASKGHLRKMYEKEHHYRISNIKSARIESGLMGMGKRLAIEIIDAYGTSKTIRYEHLENPQNILNEILKRRGFKKKEDQSMKRLISILISSERTSFDEIQMVCKEKIGITDNPTNAEKAMYDSKVSEILEDLIGEDIVSGYIDDDNREFVPKAVFDQKKIVVNYSVALSDIGKDGTIVIRCPRCSYNKPADQRGSQIKCPACNTTYKIPKRILDLI